MPYFTFADWLHFFVAIVSGMGGQSGFWAVVEIAALTGGPLFGLILVGGVGFGAGSIIVAYPAASAAALATVAAKRIICGEKLIGNEAEKLVLTVSAVAATTIAAGPIATLGAAAACDLASHAKESYDRKHEEKQKIDAASQEPVPCEANMHEDQDDDFVLITK